MWEKWTELRKHYMQKHSTELRKVFAPPKNVTKKAPKPALAPPTSVRLQLRCLHLPASATTGNVLHCCSLQKWRRRSRCVTRVARCAARRRSSCTTCARSTTTCRTCSAFARRVHLEVSCGFLELTVPTCGFDCQVCDKTFKSERMFEWHMRHIHGARVNCPKCDFEAQNEVELRYESRCRRYCCLNSNRVL